MSVMMNGKKYNALDYCLQYSLTWTSSGSMTKRPKGIYVERLALSVDEMDKAQAEVDEMRSLLRGYRDYLRHDEMGRFDKTIKIIDRLCGG